MSDRPILFSGPMVRALLAGTKTQTRRVASAQPIVGADYDNQSGAPIKPDDLLWPIVPGYKVLSAKPPVKWVAQHVRFAVGDRLYVREAWHAARSLDRTPPRDIPKDADIEHAATARNYAEIGLKGKFRQGMHMPRWASRLTLTVTEVRVQRVQEISPEDARDEGVDRMSRKVRQFSLFGATAEERARQYLYACVWEYEDLWNSLNAARGFGWDLNPWVVAVSFTVAQRNIDQVVP